MCTGMEIAAMAALAGGTALQNSAQRSKVNAFNQHASATGDIQRRQQEAAWEEMRRQHALEAERRAAFDESLPTFERDSQQGELDDATADIEALYRQVQARPEDGDASFSEATGEQASGPRVVQDHAARRQGEADDFAALLGNARARLGSWGEAMWQPQRVLGDTQFDIGELARQGRSSEQLHALQNRLFGQEEANTWQAAQNAYQTTGNRRAMGGNVLSTLGQMGMMYGGYKAPSGAPVAGGFTSEIPGYTQLGSHFYRPGGGAY